MRVKLQQKTSWSVSVDDIPMGSKADKAAFRNGLNISSSVVKEVT